MTPYGPVTFALLHDLRVRPLSWAERGVLHYIYLTAAATPDEKTVAVEQRAGEAVTTSWERAIGKDAAAAVGRLVESGLVAVCPEGLRITLPARETAARGREPDAAPVAPSAASTPPQGPAAWQGKPSSSPAAVRLRNDRKKFARRESPFSQVTVGETWAQWMVSAEGEAFVSAREASHPGYRAEGGTGTTVPRGTYHPGTTGGTTPLSPLTLPSLSEKRREERGEVPPPGTTPSAVGTTGGTAHGTALDGASARHAPRAASRRWADLFGRTHELPIARMLADARLTSAEVQAVAEALKTPGAWWPKHDRDGAPARVNLKRLAGFPSAARDGTYECGPLGDLITHVRAKGAPAQPRVSPSGLPEWNPTPVKLPGFKSTVEGA